MNSGMIPEPRMLRRIKRRQVRENLYVNLHRFQGLHFYTTANDPKGFPRGSVAEIAFAGRSNAGKSSAINTIANRTRLAFTSKTPGRTQHINFFEDSPGKFVVDLPGYGFAGVPIEVRRHWEHFLSNYLQKRESLQGMALLMDIRHPLTPLDRLMLEWFLPTGRPVLILLTKSDKLSRSNRLNTVRAVQKMLKADITDLSVIPFSSLNREGLPETIAVLSGWLDQVPAPDTLTHPVGDPE